MPLLTGGDIIHGTKLTKHGPFNYHKKKKKITCLRNSLLSIHIEDCNLNEMKFLDNFKAKEKGHWNINILNSKRFVHHITSKRKGR